MKAEKERIERTKLRKVFRKEQVNFVEMESEEDEDDFELNEINLAEIRAAELQAGPPYVCASLRPMKGKEKTNTSNKAYSFDITKADQIFDVLLQDKQIVLPEGKKMPSAEEIKNRKFCKYHQIIGHSTNNCVRFRDLIQKAIKDGRLKFEEKSQSSMTVDVNPFEMNSAYVEPVHLSINVAGIEAEEEAKEAMELDAFENMEKPIYPKAGEDLLDFLLKQRDAGANVAICPRCSAVFDKTAAKAFQDEKEVEFEKEKREIERERQEIKKKLVEKEAEVARLRNDIYRKQIAIGTKS